MYRKRTATLARLLLVIALLLVLTPTLGAKSSKRAKQAPQNKAAQSAPAKAEEPWPPPIPLRQNLRFTIRPTLLGLVPPGDPLGYGECFVRVLSAEPLYLHYEIKEQHSEPLGTSRTQDVTTIRRGEITVARAEPRFAPPMLWGNGSWQAGGGLLWLRPQDFAELQATGTVAQDIRAASSDSNPLSAGLNRIVAERRALYGLGDADQTQLVAQDWQSSYPAYVNGRRADLPAIRCTDSVRLAMYWILDDTANPLLLKMTYLAPSLAESEPPAPVEKPQASDARSADSEQVQSLPQAVQDPAEALIESGAGFAVVNIDF